MYKSDNIIVHGFILQKKNLEKKLPVVIFCRGGNRTRGEIFPKNILNNKTLINMAENEIAVIFFPNYRESSLSEGKDEFGGKDVNDIINLYPIIQQYKYCDVDKIALYGWSRGGLMVVLVASKVDWVKTIILGGAVYSMTRNMRDRPEMEDMFINDFCLTKNDIKERSPKYIMYMIPKYISFLILHGSADTAVSVYHAYSFGKKCQEFNLLYKLIIFPNGNHGLTQYSKAVQREVIAWILDTFK